MSLKPYILVEYFPTHFNKYCAFVHIKQGVDIYTTKTTAQTEKVVRDKADELVRDYMRNQIYRYAKEMERFYDALGEKATIYSDMVTCLQLQDRSSSWSLLQFCEGVRDREEQIRNCLPPLGHKARPIWGAFMGELLDYCKMKIEEHEN